MEKLKAHSSNLAQQNVSRIKNILPNCVVEARDEHGNIKLSIDFDQLRQELSESIVEGPQERYHLNWPGKREALVTANTPISKVLRPVRAESVNFDTTKNLFIEGDNLDALKLLQDTYLGKVKVIYIDPPYNTGNDFIYEDNFAENNDAFLKRTVQKDDLGNKLVSNTESNGRFHSDWLSMMYPRLKLARNLLQDDGVIFISIDDNEVPNLRKICDEIYGVENFVAEFIWKRRVSSAMADNNVSADQDYVICYQKGLLEGFLGIGKDFKKYSNPDNDPRGPWILDNLTVGMNSSMRPNQAYDLVDPSTGKVYPFNPNRVWAFIPESMNRMIKEGRVIFPNDESKRPMQKRFQNELKSNYNPFSTLMLDLVGMNTEATRTIQDLMGGNIFDYSKPVSLLTTLIPQITTGSDIIFDFFAGSSSTAHAVIQLNSEDGGNRRFIMVQLPEDCPEKSEAFKQGYKNIAELSKERIRRAGKKLLDGNHHEDWNKDIGFRVLRVDTSNIADVYSTPDELDQMKITFHANNIKADRTPEDLLFQVLQSWGVDLSLPIRTENIQGTPVFFVDDNALIACFASNVNEELVKTLARFGPLRVVFSDNGFESDAVKINAEQILKQLSPATEVKSI